MLLSSEPDLEISLGNYFRERLLEVSDELKSTPQEDTIWYLSNMLARFGDSDELFSYEEGKHHLTPLALLYNDAREASTNRERCLILRHLGDLSLFLGALLPESFTRRGIGKDYLVGMGGGAYDYLSENSHSNRHVFSELATTFTRMLQVVAKACSKQHFFDASDIFSLYQRWLQSRDPIIAQQLQAIGIEPLDSGFKH